MSQHKPNSRPRPPRPPIGSAERFVLMAGAIVLGGAWAFVGWLPAVARDFAENVERPQVSDGVITAIWVTPLFGLWLLIAAAWLVGPESKWPARTAGIGALAAFVVWVVLMTKAY